MGATTGSSVEQACNYKSLRWEKREQIATVVLTGPGKGNAMGPDFWREMPGLFGELDQDDDVRVVIIRGEGNNFSYGLDLPAMMNQPGFKLVGQNLAAERTRFLDMAFEMQKAINCVAACRKPVIAAVSGWCIGAGLDLISACDIRIASADAKFSLREVKVAIVADMGSLQRLPYVIGEAHTRELALTGRDVDAAWAEKIGLVTEVYQSSEALFQNALEKAQEIAQNPPIVVQGIKRVLNQAKEQNIESSLKHVALWNSAFMQSNDLAEAMMAFQQKRPPKFKGN
jgi:enoyl-CoA hydratase